MFGLIDRFNKDARIFCIMSDRTKEKLLPIVKDNVYTNDENEETRTRIYSDSFATYQPDDFENMGFKLNKVNHSVWFGVGLFHTNTVEGLWGQIKRLSNNFSGLNFNILENVEKDGIKSEDYINDWLCYFLLLRDLKRKCHGDREGPSAEQVLAASHARQFRSVYDHHLLLHGNRFLQSVCSV